MNFQFQSSHPKNIMKLHEVQQNMIITFHLVHLYLFRASDEKIFFF